MTAAVRTQVATLLTERSAMDATLRGSALSVGAEGYKSAKRGGGHRPPARAGSAHLEAAQPLRLLVRCLHALDARAPRASLAELHEPPHRAGLAFEHRLDRAIAAIAHPARHPAGQCLAAGRVPKKTPCT